MIGVTELSGGPRHSAMRIGDPARDSNWIQTDFNPVGRFLRTLVSTAMSASKLTPRFRAGAAECASCRVRWLVQFSVDNLKMLAE
jgi:hypothetical protein